MSSVADFNGAGQSLGLEMWRIEKLEPKTWPKEKHGKLFAGDAFLVLRTYKAKETSSALSWDLHFWLGKDSSQDERGAAALMTVELDDSLGGGPIQYREVHGHESQKFMALFPNGIQYEEGGIESAFNKVDRNAYEAKLYHVKGKRNPRVQRVELTASSLNEGDSFILDLNHDNVFQWNGKSSNKYEKRAAADFLVNLVNDTHGGKAEKVFLESGGNDTGADATDFWAALNGSKSDVKSAEEGGNDASAKHLPPKLIRVSDASGSLETSVEAEGTLEREQLDTTDVFLVDTGAEVFVWVGKGCTKDEKKHGFVFATTYLSQNGRPDWTPISKCVENGETPAFKSCFKQWDKPPAQMSFEEYKAKKTQADFNVGSLFAKRQREQQKLVDEGNGTIDIWRIEDFAKAPYPKEKYGQFYAGDSFIVLYSYEVRGKPAWFIYFWQGRDSSADEKGASALLAKELDDEMGGEPVQVRVVQGKEPDHFLRIFKGHFIVHEGGRAGSFKNQDTEDSYDTDGISLFHVKGKDEYTTRAVQVGEVAASLNSGDVFVLLTPETMFVWNGKHSDQSEKEHGTSIATLLGGSRAVENIEEGGEPAGFWGALGGEGPYAEFGELEAAAAEPRLFECSDAVGDFSIEELFDFHQDDLCQDDIYMLDLYSELLVWVGHGANKKERDMAFKAALSYVEHAPDGRSKDTPVMQVSAGSEPPMFTAAFTGWDWTVSQDFEDPYLKKLGQLGGGGGARGGGAPTRITSGDIGFASYDTKFPLADLKGGVPATVDPSVKEEYLSPEDFQTAFGMDKAKYTGLAAWKKKQLKKKAGLF